MKTLQIALTLIAAALLCAPAWPQVAASGTEPELGVARVSLTNGEVTLRRGESGDWVEARVNTPLVDGDTLATGRAARAEVQLDSRNFARLAADSQVNLTQLGNRRFRIQIDRGTLTYNELKDGEADIDIETPHVAVRPLERGMYRVEVGFDGRTVITVRRGKAEIASKLETAQLRPGKTMVVREGPDGDPEFHVVDAASKDDWDRWNDRREKQLRKSRSRRYVSQDIYGVEDLDDHGRWQYVSGYGYSWFPTVGLGWSPYRHGRWTWLDYYGWSWVGYEPWGWAPYHYGRWYHHHHHGWGWYPGHHYRRHYWRPALVAFFGYGSHGGFGAGFGFGNIGWVPLAPYEPYYAWYGGRYRRHGYGGRHGGRNTTIFVDNSVNIYNNYRNARTQNGVTMVDAQNFARGRVRNPRSPRQAELRQARLMRGQVPVVPEQESRGRPVRAANDRRGRGGAAQSNSGAAQGRNFLSRQPTRSRGQRTSFEQQRQQMSRSVQAFEASQPTNRRTPAAARARSGSAGTRVAATDSAGAAGTSPTPSGGNVAGNQSVVSGRGGPRARNAGVEPGVAGRERQRNTSWRNFGGVRNGRTPETPSAGAVGGSRSARALPQNTPTPASETRSGAPRATTSARTARPTGNRGQTDGAVASPSRSSGSSSRVNTSRRVATPTNWRRFAGARAGSNRNSAAGRAAARGNSGSRLGRNSAPRQGQPRAAGPASRSMTPNSRGDSRRFAPRGRSRVGNSGANRGSSSRSFNLPRPVAGNRTSGSSARNAAGGGNSRTFRQADPVEGSRGNRRSTFQPRSRSRLATSNAPTRSAPSARRSSAGSRGGFAPRTRSRAPSVRQNGGSASRGSVGSAPRAARLRSRGRSAGSARSPSFGGSRSTAGRSRSGGGFGGSARRAPAPRSRGGFGGSRGGSFGGGGRSMSRGGGMSRAPSIGGRGGGGARSGGGRAGGGSRGGGRFGRR